jgi:hypothetical protein
MIIIGKETREYTVYDMVEAGTELKKLVKGGENRTIN